MHHLTFKECNFRTSINFLNSIALSLPNLVELKLDQFVSFELEVKLWDFHSQRNENLKRIILQLDNYMPVMPEWFPWDKLLSYVPNLEDLQIKPPPIEVRHQLFGIIPNNEGRQILHEIAKIRREDSSKLRLKNLDIEHLSLTENGFTGRAEDINSLVSMPLERFTGKIVDVVHLEPFAQTLRYLNISFPKSLQEKYGNSKGRKTVDRKMTFPVLKEFHATGSPTVVFENLNKLEAVNLETIVVENLYSSDPATVTPVEYEMNINNHSFGNVTRLEVFNTSQTCGINVEGFKTLSKAMPNVKHAKMPMTRSAFRLLCRKWPNLLALTIPYRAGAICRIDDEIITGVKPGRGCDYKLQVGGKRAPNITDLKFLTDFECSGRLTDHSVYHGFLHLPQIHYLNVKFEKISKEAESALREKVSVLEIRKVKN